MEKVVEVEVEVEEVVVVFVAERRGPPWVALGILFGGPFPTVLLLFRLVVVSISSSVFAFAFFLCFLGEVAGAVTAGVLGVTLGMMLLKLF